MKKNFCEISVCTVWLLARALRPKRINSDQFNVSRLMMSFAKGFRLQFFLIPFFDTFCRKIRKIIFHKKNVLALRYAALCTQGHIYLRCDRSKILIAFFLLYSKFHSKVKQKQRYECRKDNFQFFSSKLFYYYSPFDRERDHNPCATRRAWTFHCVPNDFYLKIMCIFLSVFAFFFCKRIINDAEAAKTFAEKAINIRLSNRGSKIAPMSLVALK